jgi:hypothetical protein
MTPAESAFLRDCQAQLEAWLRSNPPKDMPERLALDNARQPQPEGDRVIMTFEGEPWESDGTCTWVASPFFFGEVRDEVVARAWTMRKLESAVLHNMPRAAAYDGSLVEQLGLPTGFRWEVTYAHG